MQCRQEKSSLSDLHKKHLFAFRIIFVPSGQADALVLCYSSVMDSLFKKVAVDSFLHGI